MATATPERTRSLLMRALEHGAVEAGDLALFAGRVLSGSLWRWGRGTLLPVCYVVGVGSIPVVMITGLFIGMVLAVQAYSEFAQLGLASRLGGVINISVVRELGPVLAATMLAGRVGSAMAAELATMRTSEQVDALACLGVNPVHYLATPRFLACVLLIPLLTVLADFMGVLGGALISLHVYHIEPSYYWEHSRHFVGLWDVGDGLLKAVFFGAAIAVISCHRGLTSDGGAVGVGRAATRAFVASFIAILVLDFFLALLLHNLKHALWPGHGSRLL